MKITAESVQLTSYWWKFHYNDYYFNLCESGLRKFFKLPKRKPIKKLWLVLDDKPSVNSCKVGFGRDVYLDRRATCTPASVDVLLGPILARYPKNRHLNLYYET